MNYLQFAPPPPGTPRLRHTITDSKQGIRAEVYELRHGRYSVVLRDTDANEVLPLVSIYRTEAGAVEYARAIVEGERS